MLCSGGRSSVSSLTSGIIALAWLVRVIVFTFGLSSLFLFQKLRIEWWDSVCWIAFDGSILVSILCDLLFVVVTTFAFRGFTIESLMFPTDSRFPAFVGVSIFAYSKALCAQSYVHLLRLDIAFVIKFWLRRQHMLWNANNVDASVFPSNYFYVSRIITKLSLFSPQMLAYQEIRNVSFWRHRSSTRV